MSVKQKLGGRKCIAFYASLGVVTLLSVLGKATTETLGLIDTLFLIYAGANVAAKKHENKTIKEVTS